MLSFHSSAQSNHRYQLLIDIGSGSVGVAISDTHQNAEAASAIVWSHREFILIREARTEHRTQQEIKTALINAFLMLGNDGLKSLQEIAPTAKIATAVACICAPWSLTAIKPIHYGNKKPFVITESLVDELVATVSKKMSDDFLTQEIFKNAELTILDTAVVETKANGYVLPKPTTTQVTDVTLTQLLSVAPKNLAAQLQDNLDKVFPRSKLMMHSFISVLYFVFKKRFPNADYCLIDVTCEATEIALIREGAISYTAHIKTGSNTIIRNIASEEQIPHEEASKYLRSYSPESEVSTQSKEVMQAYADELSALFHDTGDSLAIPKQLYVHADKRLEKYFIDIISTAAAKATLLKHSAAAASTTLFPQMDTIDTALLTMALYQNNELKK